MLEDKCMTCFLSKSVHRSWEECIFKVTIMVKYISSARAISSAEREASVCTKSSLSLDLFSDVSRKYKTVYTPRSNVQKTKNIIQASFILVQIYKYPITALHVNDALSKGTRVTKLPETFAFVCMYIPKTINLWTTVLFRKTFFQFIKHSLRWR